MQNFKLTVPNKLSELTLMQYQKFIKLLLDDNEEDFLYKKMIEIFCDVPLKYVNNFKYNSVKKVTDVLSEMFNQKPKLKTKFEMNGVKYGFHPKLTDMTFGEFVDIDSFASDWSTMDKAMGVLYRPIKDEFNGSYLIEEYDGDKETFCNTCLLTLLLALFFFC